MKLPSLPRPTAVPPDRIRVGMAGWSYADWEGIVYPRPAPAGFHRLQWIARFTDVVEINATFYRAARARDAARWVRLVEPWPGFRFCAKLERTFTHEPDPPGAAAEARWREGVAPLAEAGLLLAVLAQFPYSFRNTAAGRRRLVALLNRLADLPLVVELRHRSWLAGDVLALLSARGVTLAGIDQPAVGQSLSPSLPLTGPFFYARLHGRNAADWFRPDAGRDARYDYLYSPEELAPWADRARATALESRPGVIIANNHYRGQAAVNAVEIRAALSGRRVPAPAGLIRAYPRLAGSAEPLPSAAGGSPRLF